MGMTSGESLSFRCNSESTARLLRLIASRSGRAADISVDVADIDDVVQFTFDHGIAARGVIAASSALIKEEDSGLYGNSMEDRAQVNMISLFLFLPFEYLSSNGFLVRTWSRLHGVMIGYT